MYDDEIVAIAAPPVRDNMKFESVRFGVYQPTGEPFVELRCWATSSADPKLPGEDCTLRLYAGAEEFKAKFCADDEAAVKEWTKAQTNEKPVSKPEPEPEPEPEP